MAEIKFTKMSGTMNDFIVVDNRAQILNCDHLTDWIRKICTRKFSVGADGIIFIEKSDKADFKWRFFNCDGSEAEMCGNGARCAARFSYLEGISGPNLSFETEAGIIRAHVQKTAVKVQMPNPTEMKLDIKLPTENSVITLSKIRTGVPHAVMEVENIEEFSVPTLINLGKTIRFHKYFAPEGANINFIEVTESQNLKVRTYERGVEDITYACGTGVVASALIAHAKKLIQSPVKVDTKGGKLTVSFEYNNRTYENVYLEGDARIIYKGILTDESV